MDRKHRLIFLLISFFAVALDQFTKFLVRGNLDIGQSITIINKFFYISYYENRGAAFSFLASKDYGILILSFVSIIAVPIIIYLAYKYSDSFSRLLAFALMLGGNIGNMLDRVFRGSVTDFFDFHFASYIYPTFNIADICLVVSVFIMLMTILFEDKRRNT